jgi:hypothetical protein
MALDGAHKIVPRESNLIGTRALHDDPELRALVKGILILNPGNELSIKRVPTEAVT